MATINTGLIARMSESKNLDNQNEVKGPNGGEGTEDRVTALSVLGSVVAAAFGVQSKKNKERDFAAGKPLVFIVAGILFTGAFVLSIIAVVGWVLP